MIRFVSGTLAAVGENEVIVENGGIGYAVNIPVSLVPALPGIGGEIKLYTYFAVREDAMQLFGFLSYDDLTVFKLLIAVNGIGPKAAMGILGAISIRELCYAVFSEDTDRISKAPGIGPKTAKKIILELKDKPELFRLKAGMEEDPAEEGMEEEGKLSSEVVSDAIEALVVLGYAKKEAERAVGLVEVTGEMTVEEVLKQSLRNMI